MANNTENFKSTSLHIFQDSLPDEFFQPFQQLNNLSTQVSYAKLDS